MKTNATVNQLRDALTEVNERFEGNIRFKTLVPSGKRVSFTLTVNDSKGKGGRRSHTGRRIAAACWHVHGYFFEALLKIDSEIFITSSIGRIDKSGGNWQNRNIGSIMYPMYYSEACDC